MAKISVTQYRLFGWNDAILSTLLRGGIATGATSPTGATLQVGSVAQVKISGTGLQFSSDGRLEDGTVTGITILAPVDGGGFSKAVKISGFSFDFGASPTGPVLLKPVYDFDASPSAKTSDGKGAIFEGGAKGDTFLGSKWVDSLLGRGGNDTMHGGKGNDFLDGGKGSDKVFGDAGNDFLSGGLGDDTIDGGKGSDWVHPAILDGTDLSKPVVINLAKQTATGSYGKDKLISIENAGGADGKDKLIGSNEANKLLGGRGNDSIDGGKGDDQVVGAEGVDTVKGGAGKDSFWLNLGDANADHILDFKPGADRIVLGQALFPKLALGVVGADHFSSDGTPDADDYLIYDPTAGKLFYDDHEGGGPVLMAEFGNSPGLSGSDMIVVSAATIEPWI